MKKYAVYLCRFDSTLDIKNPTYDKIEARVLEVGRFSAFEPNQRTAWIFDRLCRDPELETFDMGFPWTGVRRRVTPTSGSPRKGE